VYPAIIPNEVIHVQRYDRNCGVTLVVHHVTFKQDVCYRLLDLTFGGLSPCSPLKYASPFPVCLGSQGLIFLDLPQDETHLMECIPSRWE
jgi:hypothetical protein